MTYSLKLWTNPRDGSERLYINGTTRQALYLKLSSKKTLVWSSKANDASEHTGDHYGKIRKDSEAAHEVCAAANLKLGGEEVEWIKARELAVSGLSFSEPEESEVDEENITDVEG